MNATADVVLPYRVEGQDLEKMVEHRARGRSMAQVRTLGFSEKGFEGTRKAAEALGLLDEEGELTEMGKEFALAREGEGRQQLVLRQMMEFEPYGLLLMSLLDSGTPDRTELEEIELWWATHGFGNSESNRERGSTALARLVDYVGLGRYVVGRGGHPSRIEWKSDASKVVAQHDPALEADPFPGEWEDEYPPRDGGAPEDVLDTTGQVESGTDRPVADEGEFAVQIPLTSLSAGRVARVIVPTDLKHSEKERLIQALEFLLMVDEQESPDREPATPQSEEDGRDK